MAVEETKRPGIMLYFDVLPALARLDLAQKGKLFESMLRYGENGAIPDFGDDAAVGVAWDFIRPRLDKDADAYERKRENAAKAVKKRWSTVKHTDEYDGIRSYTSVSGGNAEEYEAVQGIPTTATTTTTDSKGEDSSASATPRTRSARFTPPTQNEVEQFMRENGGNTADAGKFCDFYTSNGWKVGRATMKDWQAAARGWLRRDGKFTSATNGADENKYDLYAAFEGVVNGKS